MIDEIDKEWDEKKPGSGDLFPAEALDVLNRLRKKLWDIKEKYEKCCKAKDYWEWSQGILKS